MSSKPILHFDFVISIAHILLPFFPYFRSIFHVFAIQIMDVPPILYPTTGIDTASSVFNTSTAYNPSSFIPMTTTTSDASTYLPHTATTSTLDSTTGSILAVSTAAASTSTADASIPTTSGPTSPTTVAPSVHTTTTAPPMPVTPSDFTLDPVKAKEFFDADDDATLTLSDFLRKMDSIKDIYGADTAMIKGLTSNTKDHEKAKIKVSRCLRVCG